MAKRDLTPLTVEFESGQAAHYVYVSKIEAAETILKALKIKKASAVMTVVGGAKALDEDDLKQLAALFSRGVARAANKRACLVITGGTNAGVMKMMGQGLADRGRTAPCIGIAPFDLVKLDDASEAEKTPLDPNHSHFVLVDGNEWGDETETMYRLARHFSDGVPSIAIVANGGAIAEKEVLYNVRQGRRMVVIEGSGRFADKLAALWRAYQAKQAGKASEEEQNLLDALNDDPPLREIIEEGKIYLFPLDGEAGALESLLLEELPPTVIDDEDLLTEVWKQYAIFSETSKKRSKQFHTIRRVILWVGVLTVAFAVFSSSLDFEFCGRTFNRILPYFSVEQWQSFLQQAFHIAALILPVLGAVLLAGANRFHPGETWVTLRGGTEDIKKEIFRYRARVYPYDQQDRPDKLAKKIQQLGDSTVGGNVKKHELLIYKGPVPPTRYAPSAENNGFNELNGEGYLKYRLDNQIDFFEGKGREKYGKVKRWQWIIYASGGLGTLLGLFGLDALIAITSSMGMALGSYMEMVQAENILRGYNETAQILRGIRARWRSANSTPLSPIQYQKAFTKMVENTEHALVTERSRWIDAMNEALKEFQEIEFSAVEGDEVPPQV